MFEAVLYAFIFDFYSFFLQAFYGCGYGAEVLFLIVAFQFEVHVCVNCMCKMDRRILLMGFLDEHRLGLFVPFANNDRNLWLDDTRLFACNLAECIPEELGVVKTDVRDNG